MSRGGEPRRHADRAAQFMPFAALTGYYDLVRERERVTEPRREPSEEDAERISSELAGTRPRELVRVPSRFLRTFRQPHRPAIRCGYPSSSVTSR